MNLCDIIWFHRIHVLTQVTRSFKFNSLNMISKISLGNISIVVLVKVLAIYLQTWTFLSHRDAESFNNLYFLLSSHRAKFLIPTLKIRNNSKIEAPNFEHFIHDPLILRTNCKKATSNFYKPCKVIVFGCIKIDLLVVFTQ